MTYALEADTICEATLKAQIRELAILLYYKPGCKLYARLLSSNLYLYILEIRGQEDYWTCNESQAVERFNQSGMKVWRKKAS